MSRQGKQACSVHKSDFTASRQQPPLLAGPPESPVVAAPNDVQPASAGTTTPSDILLHYSTLTTAMDLKEKNGQLAEEAAHWIARTEELEKEIAGVGRGQSM